MALDVQRGSDVPLSRSSPSLEPQGPTNGQTPDTFQIISPDVLTIENLTALGNSDHSTVYQGRWSGKVVAVKRLPEDTPAESVIQQTKNWQQLSNPHVLRMFGASPVGVDPPYIVSELMTSGNVSAHVLKNPRADRKKLIHEIAIGMEYLHGKNVVHGGLKASNILINASGHALIADFGLYQWKASSGATSSCRYLSPEAWKGSITKPSDVFAYAMTAYEIFTSSQPWGFLADNLIYNLVVREGERPDRPDRDWEIKIGMDDHIWGLIEACWKQDHRARPTFQQLIPMFENGVGRNRASGPPPAGQTPGGRTDPLANMSAMGNSLPASPSLPTYGTDAPSQSQPAAAGSSSSSAPAPAATSAPANTRMAQAHAAKARLAVVDADPNDSVPPPPAYDPVGDMEPSSSLPPPQPAASEGSSSNQSPPASQRGAANRQTRMMVANPTLNSTPTGQAAFAFQPTATAQPSSPLPASYQLQQQQLQQQQLQQQQLHQQQQQAQFNNANQMHPAMGGAPMGQYGMQPNMVGMSPGMTPLHAPLPVQAGQPAVLAPAVQQRWAHDERQWAAQEAMNAQNAQYVDPRALSPGAGGLSYQGQGGLNPMTPQSMQQSFTDQRRTSNMSNTSWDTAGVPHSALFSNSPSGTPRSAQFSGITSINENQAYSGMDPYGQNRVMSPPHTIGSPSQRVDSPSAGRVSAMGTTMQGGGGVPANASAMLVVNALTSEMSTGRNRDLIDEHLVNIHQLGFSSEKEAQKLITAGAIPALIQLLKARALDGLGLEVVMITLGVLAHDPVSANTVYRTGTTKVIFELVDSSNNQDIVALAIWVLIRLCRSNDLVQGLIKADLVPLLLRNGLTGQNVTARMASWCLGNLVRNDATADQFASQGLIETCVNHLIRVSSMPTAVPEDKCAAMYSVARMARSIKLSKAIAKAGGVEPLVQYLNSSTDPNLLRWGARSIGCLMRPNSADMSKILLDAGAAKGLARLPQVIPTESIDPLESFAFAVQRFSCAEWGSTTRKALVDAGVVDSLLAALRTAADVPYPQTHIELALAVSFLGDVGGASIRKEITRAGGIEILRNIGAAGKPEVAKACTMAVTSITGNLWTRNAASAKTAMSHNWSGGCPDHQPPCPPLSGQERM